MYATIYNNRHRKVIEWPQEVLMHCVLSYNEVSEHTVRTFVRVFLSLQWDNDQYQCHNGQWHGLGLGGIGGRRICFFMLSVVCL